MHRILLLASVDHERSQILQHLRLSHTKNLAIHPNYRYPSIFPTPKCRSNHSSPPLPIKRLALSMIHFHLLKDTRSMSRYSLAHPLDCVDRTPCPSLNPLPLFPPLYQKEQTQKSSIRRLRTSNSKEKSLVYHVAYCTCNRKPSLPS